MGGATIKTLEGKGYEVINYDLKNSYDPYDLLDICDEKTLKKYMEKGDKILHLAAIARFADAEKEPGNAWQTNIAGTRNVIKVACDVGAERIVHASTGSVYMPVGYAPINEHHPIEGNSDYGYTKRMAEEAFKIFCSIPWVILRYAHLYGPEKIGHGAVGGFVDRIKRGVAPVIMGGRQQNDFTAVADVVQANLLALETEHVNECYNIGTGIPLSTKEAFEIMAEVWGYEGDFEYQPPREVDPPSMAYDISKARRLLGYDPKYDFKAGLKEMWG